MTTAAPNYKIGNEKLIKVLPNASAKLTSLLTKQGRAEHDHDGIRARGACRSYGHAARSLSDLP